MPKIQSWPFWQLDYYFQPVAVETTGVYGKPTAPFLSCLAKKLVDIDFRQPQGATVAPAARHLSLAVVRGNTTNMFVLACVQVWSDFSHPQRIKWLINQCSCPSLASLQWIAIAFRMSAFSVSFVCCLQYVFYAFCKAFAVQCCFAPFLTMLTNLIFFVNFSYTQHYCNTECITVYCYTFL